SPTHEVIYNQAYKLNRISEFSFIGGSNLLSSDHSFLLKKKYNQWAVNIFDALKINNPILLGVGWKNYQVKPNFLTSFLYRKLLSSKEIHSVRDNYTLQKLKEVGINNAINTGCPTMWGLDKAHCDSIPDKKANIVVFTLTDYNRSPEHDKILIEILKRNYDEIFFWPQGRRDNEYLHCFNTDGIKIINPNLSSYDQLLSQDIDFIGTRLHAGIRAIQKKKRAIILGIDNRAEEIRKDTNLFVINRDEVNSLNEIISSRFKTDILVNFENICKWKKQFM
ncbi:hypothetical protein BIY29_19160, partial [Brenneria alni]